MITNGVDIVEVNRFNNLSKKFLENTFTSRELDYINSKNNNIETIAGIYAAKEAVLKSMSIALNVISLKNIEILHENNCPYVNILDEKKRDGNYSLSISHDGAYAIAFVIRY